MTDQEFKEKLSSIMREHGKKRWAGKSKEEIKEHMSMMGKKGWPKGKKAREERVKKLLDGKRKRSDEAHLKEVVADSRKKKRVKKTIENQTIQLSGELDENKSPE